MPDSVINNSNLIKSLCTYFHLHLHRCVCSFTVGRSRSRTTPTVTLLPPKPSQFPISLSQLTPEPQSKRKIYLHHPASRISAGTFGVPAPEVHIGHPLPKVTAVDLCLRLPRVSGRDYRTASCPPPALRRRPWQNPRLKRILQSPGGSFKLNVDKIRGASIGFDHCPQSISFAMHPPCRGGSFHCITWHQTLKSVNLWEERG